MLQAAQNAIRARSVGSIILGDKEKPEVTRHGVDSVVAGRGVGRDMGDSTTALLQWPETRSVQVVTPPRPASPAAAPRRAAASRRHVSSAAPRRTYFGVRAVAQSDPPRTLWPL